MDIEKLTNSLISWLVCDTWHTGHAMDDQRFHRALKASFDTLGVQISSHHFREAIELGLQSYRPGDVRAFSEDIESYAQRAEDIGAIY